MKEYSSFCNSNFFTYYDYGKEKTALVFSGLPSLHSKKSIAQMLSFMGFNTASFFYKGTWASKGKFLFQNLRYELSEFLESSAKSEFSDVFSSELFAIKPIKIAVGFSFGGALCLLNSDMFEKAVAFAPPLFVNEERIQRVQEHCSKLGRAYELAENWQETLREMNQPIERMQINAKNLLVIHGKTDEIVPLHENEQFYKNANLNYKIIEAGHFPSALLFELAFEEIFQFLHETI